MKLLPQVEALEGRYENVKFTKVEGAKNRALCIDLKVMGMPTFLFYKNGKEIQRLSGGNVSLQAIEETIGKII